MREFWNMLRSKFIHWLSNWGNPDTRDFRYMLWFFNLVILAGLFAVGIYNEGRQAVTPILWALACLLSGAFVGFLFGIPKILQTDARPPLNASVNNLGTQSVSQNSTYRQQVNTNLTEISDWLTKIIVGLGLINLKEIPHLVKKAAVLLAASMHEGGPDQDHLAYAVAIIVSFSILGFLFGYLTTRLYLAGAFSRADQQNQNPKLSDFQPKNKIVDYSGTKEVAPEMKKSVMNFLAEARPQAGSTEDALEYYLRHSADRDPTLDKDNLHYFRLKFWLDADNARMLDQIDKVVYVLHPTFQNPIREINDRQTCFGMNTIAWGEFNLKAILHFKNGKPPLTLERYIDFGTS
jgi:hypothetical protein